MKSTNVLDEISSTFILQVQETTNRKFQTFLILYSGLRLEARRVGIRESESRTQEKKKDMETRDRKIFVEISRDLFEPRERDWILLPRGRKLAPSRFTPLYGKFEPLVSPTVRKHPPMMHPSSNFRWKFHRNLYPISSKPYLSLSFPPPSIYASRYDAVCVIDHSFDSGLTCRELNGKGERRGSRTPFGNLLFLPCLFLPSFAIFFQIISNYTSNV